MKGSCRDIRGILRGIDCQSSHSAGTDMSNKSKEASWKSMFG